MAEHVHVDTFSPDTIFTASGTEHASSISISSDPIHLGITTGNDYHDITSFTGGYTYHDTTSNTGDYDISCTHNTFSDANMCTGTWTFSK